jgi:hypothetical protein
LNSSSYNCVHGKKLLLGDLLSNITTYGVILKIPFNCVLLQSHSFSNKLNNHRGPKEGSIQGPITVFLSYLPFVLEVQAKVLMKASNFVHAHPGFTSSRHCQKYLIFNTGHQVFRVGYLLLEFNSL